MRTVEELRNTITEFILRGEVQKERPKEAVLEVFDYVSFLQDLATHSRFPYSIKEIEDLEFFDGIKVKPMYKGLVISTELAFKIYAENYMTHSESLTYRCLSFGDVRIPVQLPFVTCKQQDPED